MSSCWSVQLPLRSCLEAYCSSFVHTNITYQAYIPILLKHLTGLLSKSLPIFNILLKHLTGSVPAGRSSCRFFHVWKRTAPVRLPILACTPHCAPAACVPWCLRIRLPRRESVLQRTTKFRRHYYYYLLFNLYYYYNNNIIIFLLLFLYCKKDQPNLDNIANFKVYKSTPYFSSLSTANTALRTQNKKLILN